VFGVKEVDDLRTHSWDQEQPEDRPMPQAPALEPRIAAVCTAASGGCSAAGGSIERSVGRDEEVRVVCASLAKLLTTRAPPRQLPLRLCANYTHFPACAGLCRACWDYYQAANGRSVAGSSSASICCPTTNATSQLYAGITCVSPACNTGSIHAHELDLLHAPQVTLQTERASLARLAKASMCTGYQLSNAEMRLLLERGAGAGACDSTTAYNDAGVEPEPQLSACERSGLSPAAAAHVAALETRLRRLEAQCGAGGAAEQVNRP